jgi:disulfide bond formation protein DsbB
MAAVAHRPKAASAAAGRISVTMKSHSRNRTKAPERRPAQTIPIAVQAAPSVRSNDSAWLLVCASWLIAAASTLGALFFSEVMDLPPCVLCWWQRIFVFPLAVMLPFALFPFDGKVVRYALPLAIGGGLVALFHVLLVAGVVPESVKPCTQGVPCTDMPIRWLGFVTIPLMSLVAFSTIVALLLLARTRASR